MNAALAEIDLFCFFFFIPATRDWLCYKPVGNAFVQNTRLWSILLHEYAEAITSDFVSVNKFLSSLINGMSVYSR